MNDVKNVILINENSNVVEKVSYISTTNINITLYMQVEHLFFVKVEV